MTCSPHAIFKYLLTQTEFQEYLHVWVIDDFSDNESWMGLYRDDPNVKFIKFQSCRIQGISGYSQISDQ